MAESSVPRPRPWRLSVARQPWGLTVGELVAVLALSVSLSGVIRGGGWWTGVLLIGTLVLLCGVVARIVGVPRPLVAVVQGAVLLLAVSAVFAGRSAALGIVPTGGSFGTFGALVRTALTQMRHDSAPAPASPALLFVVVAGSGVLVIVLDALSSTLRRPAWAGVVLAVVLTVATLTVGQDPWAIAACAFAYLYLIRCGERVFRGDTARPGAAFVIAAGAVLVALLVSSVVPMAPSPATAQGGSAGGLTTVSPLVELGQDLRQPRPVGAFDYTTTSPQPPYLTLMTLDRFSGNTWTSSDSMLRRLGADGAVGPAPGLSRAVRVSRVTTRVRIGGLVSRFLPAPSTVLAVRGVSDAWEWSPADLTIGSRRSTTRRGQSYTVDSEEIAPTVRQLDDAGGRVPGSVRPDLALPAEIPPIIVRTARSATAGATNEYQRALDLQDYFREHGFVYSTTTPLRQGYDGAGLAVIATFLRVKSGYCVHFASAMAVMARVLGIPAVIDVGYVPGTPIRQAAGGPADYAVSSDDLHAWPVLYLGGLGWVPFEPTVGTSTVPSYSVPSAAGLAASSAAPASRSSRAAQQRRLVSESGKPVRRVTPPGSRVPADALGWMLVVLLAIALALIVAPASARLRRRRRRLGADASALRRAEGPPRRLCRTAVAGDAWAEIADSALDLGLTSPANSTPRTLARALEHLLDARSGTDAGEALRRLLAATEWERFGPGPGSARRGPASAREGAGLADERRLVEVVEDMPGIPPVPVLDDAVTMLRALRSRAGVVSRVRARLFPRTQWDRVLQRLRQRRIGVRD